MNTKHMLPSGYITFFANSALPMEAGWTCRRGSEKYYAPTLEAKRLLPGARRI